MCAFSAVDDNDDDDDDANATGTEEAVMVCACCSRAFFCLSTSVAGNTIGSFSPTLLLRVNDKGRFLSFIKDPKGFPFLAQSNPSLGR